MLCLAHRGLIVVPRTRVIDVGPLAVPGGSFVVARLLERLGHPAVHLSGCPVPPGRAETRRHVLLPDTTAAS